MKTSGATASVFVISALLTSPLILKSEDEEQAPNKLEVTFEGNKGFSSSRLLSELDFLIDVIQERAPDRYDVDDLADEIVRFYRSQGFPNVTASGILTRAGNTHTVSITIEEGPRTWLGEVEVKFSSQKGSVPVSDIEACFQWQTTGFLGLGAEVYSEPAREEGLANVLTLYRLHGFFDAEVKGIASPPDGEGRVDFLVTIDEGKRYYLREVPSFGGNSVTVKELEGALKIEFPLAASPRWPLILKGRLLDFYRNRGHRFAKIQVQEKRLEEKGEVRLSFEIEEGPMVRIGSIAVDGNERTEDWVILRRLKLSVGDMYSEDGIRESYRSLLRSGLFSSVYMQTATEPDADNSVRLDVSVTEKPVWGFSLLVGYGSYEKLRGGIVVENVNVLGTGHRVRAEAIGHFKGEWASLSYLNPFFFHENVTHSVRARTERREHPSFTNTEFGGNTGVGFIWTEQMRSDVGYNLRQSNVADVSGAVPVEFQEDVFLSTLSFSTLLEFRKNLIDPTRGFSCRFGVEYSGGPIGSEIDFLRYTAHAAQVVPLLWNVRLVLNGRTGIIDRLADTDTIPIQERFFSGGESSIRSFLEDEAGPTSAGDPIGGETLITLNAELRFPIWWNLHGAIFYDIGNVAVRLEDYGGGFWQSGIGGGLRLNTPVGPFRFDAAINPKPRFEEDVWAFHFALGYPF